ncbi:MAG: hypothetical protein ACD_12C00045G0002 [uncultured bacterium]|nr:MAG: hypothetical protein ACD_12C00045G0002 [uncultured bacterium]
MGIKERNTKILLFLFLIPANPFDGEEFGQKLQKIFDFSLNQKTKGTISGLIKKGLIQQIKNINTENKSLVSEKNKYILTEKGYRLLCLEFPFFRSLKEEWDGVWRIISYEIPETKRDLRDRLRREMRGWGLGPWHRSFWLSPHPIIGNLKELVYGREEEKYIQAFESTHVFGDLIDLIEKVWNKEKIEKKYRELFTKWHEILSDKKNNFQKMKEITSLYIDLLRTDPGLPKGLINQKWIGFEAFSIFKEIKATLLK